MNTWKRSHPPFSCRLYTCWLQLQSHWWLARRIWTSVETASSSNTSSAKTGWGILLQAHQGWSCHQEDRSHRQWESSAGSSGRTCHSPCHRDPCIWKGRRRDWQGHASQPCPSQEESCSASSRFCFQVDPLSLHRRLEAEWARSCHLPQLRHQWECSESCPPHHLRPW